MEIAYQLTFKGKSLQTKYNQMFKVAKPPLLKHKSQKNPICLTMVSYPQKAPYFQERSTACSPSNEGLTSMAPDRCLIMAVSYQRNKLFRGLNSSTVLRCNKK